jgi:iron(III) transport system substrate-binding protein
MKSLLIAAVTTSIFFPAFFGWPLESEEHLVEGAKKEQKLVLYTTLDLPQSIQLVNNFMEKYPLLDIEIHPLETETLVKRVRHEARTNLPGADVLLGGGGSLQPLFDERLLAAYHSSQREGLTEALVDKYGYWSGFYINSYALGYSTARVKPDETPRSYDQLLHPRWRGTQIAIDGTAHALLRGLSLFWGSEKALAYLRLLAGQYPVMARASIAAVESLHTGDVSIAIGRAPVIQGYRDKLRSPIESLSLEPVIAQIDALMLTAQSAHPNAARLFVNFALSKQGQNALAEIQQIAVRPELEQHKLAPAKAQKWFIERPDGHANVQASIKEFQEIFGMR